GMAAVYLATEVNLHRKVAIKVLPPELTFGPGSIERFQREARTAAALDHPNIIPIYRIAPGGRLFWYAMKFLEGRSLEAVLKEKGRLELDETIKILEQVADALDYAHERDVIHRDVKPANIMLDSRNRVVVTDFGIAKELSAGSFTASGSVLGTPNYMSPEQCTGKGISGKADQYATAVMTYEMISGHLPFEADSAVELLHKHCFVEPPPLEELRPGLPQHVYRAVRRALSKRAHERFETVSAFVRALKEPSPDATTTDIEKRPSKWRQAETVLLRPERRKVRLAWLVSGAALVVASAGGAVYWLTQGERLGAPQGTETAIQPPAAEDTTAAPESGAVAAPETQPAQPVRAAPAPTTGRLVINDLPSGGSVTIDGQARRGTNFTLAEGEHTVRLEAAGFESVTRTVTVAAGQLTNLAFDAPALQTAARSPQGQPAQVAQPAPPQPTVPPAAQFGVLVVRTQGGWARISVDGVFQREGSTHRDTLPAGTHTIRLERDGYVTVDTTVTLRAGETSLVRIRMRRGN
ncbi:MAG: serine/threonine-protein kinase, partial [Gemmatimonadales bacterium]